MSELVVGDYTGNEQPVSVSNTESSDDSSSADRCVDDWNMISQLALEGSIEVL